MKLEFDNGFAFGKGLFETIKVVNKRPIMLEKHIARINRSSEILEIENSLVEEEVLDYIEKSQEKNYALKAVISDRNKIFVKREDIYINLDRSRGISVNISEVLRNSTSHMVYHKSLNYYDNIIEKKKSRANGHGEVIFVNEKGNIAEGAVSNIFFIKNGEISTPSLDSGILRGTVRDYITENWNVNEREIKKEELENFDSAFITNSLFGIQWIESIENIKYSKDSLIEDIIEKMEKMGY